MLTDRQTDMLITILCSSVGGTVMMLRDDIGVSAVFGFGELALSSRPVYKGFYLRLEITSRSHFLVSRSKSWSSVFILRPDVEVLRSFVRRGGWLIHYMSSLQIYHWLCQRQSFENRLTCGEVMGQGSNIIWTHGVYTGWAKKVGEHRFVTIILSNLNRFLKKIHWKIPL